MSISSSDIAHLQSAAASSSGGAITASGITSGVPNNVWPDVTDAQRVAGIVLYRKTFFKNNHASDAMVAPTIYIPTAPTNATLVLGLGINSSSDTDSGQGNMTAFGADALACVVSDTAGDARVVRITGLNGSGAPVTETVTLNGTTEVLSANTYSKVWGCSAASTDGAKTITIKQGSGGTTRGVIGPTKIACWLWVLATSKGAGILLPDLAASQNYGVWRRLTVAANAGSVRPDTLTVRIEETF